MKFRIDRCDRLPVVNMKVAGENRRFLLDTAATTILNLKSFTSGESKQIHIYSWGGSAATSAREVFLPQVELGTHKLRDLKLPAIDLSPIGKACGGQIDGILGVDLLDQMGMTIDLKRRVAVPAPAGEPGDSADVFAEAERDLGSCIVAFNQGDVKAMEQCFDPEIVFYTQHGEYRGRQEVMRYLSQRYFKFAPKLHYEVRPRDVRSFGDALWYSYDFWIDTFPFVKANPCSSTGTGMILAPALRNTAVSPKYPGSSIHTASPGFRSTRARMSSPCCTPDTIAIWSGEQFTPRDEPR